MQEEIIFGNSALNDALKLYVDNKENEDSLNYNKFICSVIRMLVLIYGEDVIKSYENNDMNSFDNVLTKYGFDINEVNNFKTVFDKYYQFDLRQQKKAIKKKNKFFNFVQKYLIDMMKQRTISEKVDMMVMNEFYDLLFTANSKDFYRKSTAVLLAYNPYEIDDYAKKQGIVVG